MFSVNFLRNGSGLAIAIFPQLFISAICLYGVVDTIWKNKKVTGRAIVCLLVPVIIFYFSYPTIQDVRDYENGVYETSQVTIQEVHNARKGKDSILTSDNERYYVDNLSAFSEGDTYEIDYMPRTKNVIDSKPVANEGKENTE